MGLPVEAVARDGAWTPESAAYAARAGLLGLRFVSRVVPVGGAIPVEAVRRGSVAWCRDGTLAIAPDPGKVAAIAAWLARHPRFARRLVIATPSEIRRALIATNASGFIDTAVNALGRRYPAFSARSTVSFRQAVALLLALAVMTLAVTTDPFRVVGDLGVTATLFFLAMSVFRFAAARAIRKKTLRAIPAPDAGARSDDDLPIYTILVPLHREAAVVRSLIAALRRIDWPSDRLDIKLVLEEDDAETRAEVRRHLPGPPFEAIVVPNVGPKTKPKALAFAHLFSRGAFVTVYDAEDDPHPRQLREAFARFRTDPGLACVQAPLLIDNPDPTWIARLFAIEYSCLFDGLLPYLASKGLPLPLGGTSNHFRRSMLDEIGGWDPFNVTEDADLGLRLARNGYRVATIALPTYEEAPVTFRAWMRQRTRWFKGWMQTCLVHTRHPIRLARDLGLRRTFGFIAIQLGMVASALLHPFFIALLIVVAADPSALLAREDGAWTAALLAIGLANLFAGYAAMTTLANRTLPLRGLRRIEGALVWLPLYWLLMSVAVYRAGFQLLVRPHYWDKTTHLGLAAGFKQKRIRRGQQPLFAAR